jgi:hypothetical protein
MIPGMATGAAQGENQGTKKEMRQPKSLDRLRKAYTHLQYEFRMLKGSAFRLRTITPNNSPESHAIFESFVIHSRNLLYFLYSNNPRDTDIIAEDFIPASRWRAERPQESSVLKRAHERASKEVAHLTWNRLGIDYKTADWPITEIAKDIIAAYDMFAELVQQEHPNLSPAPGNANVISICTTATFTKREMGYPDDLGI